MSSGHEEDMSGLHIWFHVHSTLLGIIFLSTLVLNTLLILVLRKMKSRRSNRDCASYNIERSYMYLLFHLALADMLGVILNIPFDMFRNAGIVYYFTSAGCQMLPPFQLASTTAQAGTYVALSYHRFRAIVHPIRAKLTVYKSLIMISIIWFISICLSMPFAIVHRFNETASSCYEEWTASAGNIYTFAIFVVQYAAPVSLMAVFYVTIARALHDHRIAKERINVPIQDDIRSHKHIVKMLVTIVTVYGVCMLPHHIFWIVGGLEDVDQTVYDTVSNIIYLFTYSNSVANPLVFFYYSKESRYHLRRFFNKLPCARTIDVPFEIKKLSATWSGVSKSDSQRPHDRNSSKEHLKLDKLFLPKPGDSDLGVSLPWEAQVMTSHASSGSYRDYLSSPPLHPHSLSPEDPLEHTNYTTNPFLYAVIPEGTQTNPTETILDILHENEESFTDDNACAEDVFEVCEDDDPGEETGGCGEPKCENGSEDSVDSTEGYMSGHDQEGMSEIKDEGGLPWDEEETETASDSDEDDTARVQHMIERMIKDIRQELKQDGDGAMNGMRKLEDILNLNESSSNGEWYGEGFNGDTVKDMTGYQESEEDILGLKKHLESLPETRM